MIVKCEKCESEFSLNESLLKKEGSTVRCSVCKNVFKVFPQKQDPFVLDESFSDSAMEETVALDMPPDIEGIEEEPIEEDRRDSFDRAFEEAMEEVEEEVLVIPDEELIPEQENADEFHAEQTDKPDVTMPRFKRIEKGTPNIRLISLLIVLFLIIASLVVYFYFPEILPDSIYSLRSPKETASDKGIDRIGFGKIKHDFAESDKAGELFIISGSVINNYSKSRSYILLKGGLQREDGKLLKEQKAYAGNILTDEQLKEISGEEIKTLMKNRTGLNNNVDIKPGGAVPFMIIITLSDLPDKDKIYYYTVEAESSSPGK